MLSDEAKNLRTWLDMQRSDGGGPVTISPEGIECIIETINSLIRVSKELEALGVGQKKRRTVEHLNSDNIIQFPVVSRPVPHAPEGGAA